MRPPRSRPTLRRAPAGALAVALLTLATALGPVTAAAAPTATPTPGPSASSTPAATSDPTPVATPTPGSTPAAAAAASASATPTPAAGPRAASPSASPTAQRTTAVPTAPAPEVPVLLRRAADGHRLSRVAPAAAILVDPRYEVSVVSACATADEPGSANLVAAPRGDGFDGSLTFRLTLDGDVIAEGPLDLDSELGADVDSLAAGRYLLTTYVDGATEPSTEADVPVASCLTPTTDCTGTTFTNPAGNPAIGVVHGPTGAEEEDAVDNVLFLTPGSSRTVRVAYAELQWAAFSGQGLTDEEDDDEEDEDEPVALVGDGVLDVGQGCGANRATTGQVGCVTGGGTARLELDVELGAQEDYAYVITDADGRAVARRSVESADGSNTSVAERLPGRGTYTYALTFDGAQLPYESFDLTVLDCLDVEVGCGVVVLTNPARNPEVEVFSGAPDQTSSTGHTTLAPGASQRVPWAQDTFRWVADASDPAGITESAGRADVTVAQDCAGTGGGADPVSAPGTGPGLADTGGPAGGLVGPAGALALAVAGVLLLGRGRRRA
ncbi:hypothetical protein SAMN04488543_4229 [Friedmanniella luteola]|uniref:Gram-positive cocci surface proteins LPxTG domain-containing protein n=1 Tax=Friedmanniella luteola TaxID=546871 RepID=A0A1H2A5Q7_9ACTN|nr:hypothetical protein [Friedmanniella luteola]SDT41122.1 hypothetical protein SAMN04488543_4229 [Friedmanniella luteola]